MTAFQDAQAPSKPGAKAEVEFEEVPLLRIAFPACFFSSGVGSFMACFWPARMHPSMAIARTHCSKGLVYRNRVSKM